MGHQPFSAWLLSLSAVSSGSLPAAPSPPPSRVHPVAATSKCDQKVRLDRVHAFRACTCLFPGWEAGITSETKLKGLILRKIYLCFYLMLLGATLVHRNMWAPVLQGLSIDPRPYLLPSPYRRTPFAPQRPPAIGVGMRTKSRKRPIASWK